MHESKLGKVIVTGGAGFIGSHIVDALLENGNYVTVIDDLSTGKIKNIEHHLSPSSSVGDGKQAVAHYKGKTPNFEFVHGSITDLLLLQKLFSGADYVFHEAALASVPRSVANPQVSNEVNITGTLNVLLAARDNKVKKLIYAASSSAYGDTPTLPKREDMAPSPQSPYAVTKLTAEYYCGVFTEVYHLPTVCLRYFNVYGPRQDPKSEYAAVIPKFIELVKSGKSPVIYGDGEQTRDFTFIRDVVAANLIFAKNEATGVYNIGRGERITLNALANSVIRRMGKNIKPVYAESRAGDIKHSLADISKARAVGYNPQCDVETCLTEVIRSM